MINSFSHPDNLSDKLLSKCPVCGNKNDILEMTVLSEQKENNIIYIECRKCYTNFIGTINFGLMGVSVISFATDLKKSEVLKFQKGKRVSEDDVLELYSILENKNKNFLKDIISERKNKSII